MRPPTVDGVDTALVELPLERPVSTPGLTIDALVCVLVTLRMTDGVEGTGFCYTIDRDHGAALRRRVDALAAAAIDPTGRDDVIATAALDVARADAVARRAGRSLATQWGAVRDRIDCYASAGFWLSESEHGLVEAARRCAASGIRTVKVRIGHDLDTDLARIAAVREALGPAGVVHVDAAQAFGRDDAIRRGRALADAGVTWFEEPVAAADHVAMAAIRRAGDVRVAAGESEIGPEATIELVHAGAVDIVMPDLQHVGGFTAFRRVADVAGGRHVALSSHFFTEYTLSLAASLPRFGEIEWIDWFAPLFAEPLEFADGRIIVPDRPGHGFTFAPDVVDRYGL